MLATKLRAATAGQVAWDISYAYYDPPAPLAGNLATAVGLRQYDTSLQDTSPQSVFFKPDGTKMYVLGNAGNDVNEYNLSTPWTISTAIYSQNFSVGTQETSPTGLFFRDDGLKMYVCGTSGDDVNEYTLSTAWDISTASYLRRFSVAAQDTSPQSIFFKPDGLKMYILGGTGDDVNEYNLALPWDISTASYLQNFSVSAQETSPTGLAFSLDGKLMYVCGSSSDSVHSYGFDVAWDISTAGFAETHSVLFTAPEGVFVDAIGGAMYVTGTYNDGVDTLPLVIQYVLGGRSTFPEEVFPTGLFFKPDGTKMYVCGTGGDDVNEYNLSTAWDIGTLAFFQNFSVAAQETSPESLFFKPDGTKMYILGSSGDDVNEYNLSVAWYISTASYLQSFSVAAQETSPTGLFFKPDGTKMYVCGTSGDDVNEYDLSTAWDVSTASYLQRFSVAAQDTAPSALFFRGDGLKMYVCGNVGDDVNEYRLSTSWDISTASFVQRFFVGNQAFTPEGLFFKPDGKEMYILDDYTNKIYEYAISIQP